MYNGRQTCPQIKRIIKTAVLRNNFPTPNYDFLIKRNGNGRITISTNVFQCWGTLLFAVPFCPVSRPLLFTCRCKDSCNSLPHLPHCCILWTNNLFRLVEAVVMPSQLHLKQIAIDASLNATFDFNF